MKTLSDVTTPALVLDKAILVRNLDRMQAKANLLGVALRPHLKTAKSIEVARLALERGARGITVSTLKEAEFFAERGVVDIFYAVSIIGRHVARLAALVKAGVSIQAGVDSVEAARQIVAESAKIKVALTLRIEIDSGEHRGGVQADSAELLEIARILRDGGHRISGVFTHGGHAYATDAAARTKISEDEHHVVKLAAKRLNEAGFAIEVVSWGSTPTAVAAKPSAGITELRCGVYTFGDLYQAGIGSHTMSDIAVSVLATVIRQRPEENSLIIDAGSLALSKDRSTAALGPAGDMGFGLIANEDGTPLKQKLTVSYAFQEHGVVKSAEPIDFLKFPLGSRVRVLPNHACITAAAYDSYHVVENGNVVAVWSRVNGW
ncbi:alanine racemase [Oleiharenicola lentus]|uniref:alanine racemase n=1 Tax=Oleiharenicola lentus TaxID=2508720 RepID=UPI003F67D3FD